MSIVWPIQGSAEFTKLYGNPDANGDGAPDKLWVANHLTTIIPPYHLTYEGRPVHGIIVNRECAAALVAALTAISDHYKTEQALRVAGLTNFSGLYNFRKKRAGSSLSMHAR